MRLRIKLYLLGLLLLAGLYFAFVTGPTGPESVGRGRLIPSLDTALVDSLSVATPDAGASLVRSGGAWMVEATGDSLMFADPLLVDRALTALAALDREEPVSIVAEKHALFGVRQDSSTTVSFGPGGPDILLGKPSPDGRSVYVRRSDESEVYAAPAATAGAFLPNPLDWRDRALVRFDPSAVREFVYRGTRSPGTVALRLTEDGWSLTVPERRLVHPKPLEIVLGAIRSARAAELIEGHGPDAKEGFELRLVLEDGTEFELLVREAEDDHIIDILTRGRYRLGRERFDLIEETILSIVDSPEILES